MILFLFLSACDSDWALARAWESCDQEVNTPTGTVMPHTRLTVEYAGETTITRERGEFAQYDVALTASSCGSAWLELASWVVTDPENDDGWLASARDNVWGAFYVHEPLFYDEQLAWTFDGDTSYGLFYTWYDGVGGSAVNGTEDNFDPVLIEAGETIEVSFIFDTSYTPDLATFQMGFNDPMWTDGQTGTVVFDIDNDAPSLTVVVYE